MNVLFLTHSFPRSTGDSAGSFILRLAKALAHEGVTVNVIAPAAPGVPAEDTIEGIHVERFRYAPRKMEKLAYTGNMATEVANSWAAKFALVGFLGADFASAVRARRRFEPDLVHAHWWFPGGVVGAWTSKLSHVPLVTTLHGTDVRIARTTHVAQPLFRHVIENSAVTTAVSNWLSEEARKVAPSADPIIAPMPVATDLFHPTSGRSNDRLLFIGRFNAQKGLAHLLRAMAAMKRTVHLDVVGDGPDKEQLRIMAAELGIMEHINWLGQLKQHELPKHYCNAAAVVMPSTNEGLGLVAVEALLCETPVVGFNSGGLTDVIQDGRTGTLVTHGDHLALARALDDVIANPDLAREKAEAGRLYALAMFAPESVARKYKGIYESAISRGSAGGNGQQS